MVKKLESNTFVVFVVEINILYVINFNVNNHFTRR